MDALALARLVALAGQVPASSGGPDTVRLSVAVMAHPHRAGQAERLCELIADLEPRIVFDPEPLGHPSSLRTAQLAWALPTKESTHHLVLQDDVEPCPDFGSQVRHAIGSRPTAALAFFTSWGSATARPARIASLTGHTWSRAVDRYTPTLALALPTPCALRFARYADLWARPGEPDDEVMAVFLRAQNIPALVSVPQLVEHAWGPSMVGNEIKGLRRATCPLLPGDPPVPWQGLVLDPAAPRTAVTSTFSSGPHADPPPAVMRLVEDAALIQLQQEASWLGTALAPWIPTGTDARRWLDTALASSPWADRSLTTLASGVLRCRFPWPLLDELSRALRPFVEATVVEAARLGASTSLGVRPCG